MERGRCPEHQRQVYQQQDQQRGTAAQRGYGAKWRAARVEFLAAHPVCECEECRKDPARAPVATVVDHIIPHRGDLKLFWDRKNWQAMADECHNRKRQRESMEVRIG